MRPLRRQMRSRPRGITLIEVLFAIAILGMIAGLVYSSFVPTLEITQEVNAQRALYRRARVIFQRMESEFRGAFLGIYPASNRRNCELDLRDCPFFFVGEDNGSLDEVTFTSLAGRPASRRLQADQIWLHYYADKDESGQMILYREERPIHNGDFDDTVPIKTPLFHNVDRFNLRYIERGTTNDYVDEWDSTRGLDETETNHLPRAVEISIRYTDELEHEGEFITIVEIPASEPLEEEETTQQ
ncbi:MAG: prepilin-type N-terminal cleavage/methylation domain-containing protein [Chrysiogenetes bacterium]|nr:prepilin-type N-terminal cleavage/methylation domain-containing protein [Chrysiogenetes bacterium]